MPKKGIFYMISQFFQDIIPFNSILLVGTTVFMILLNFVINIVILAVKLVTMIFVALFALITGKNVGHAIDIHLRFKAPEYFKVRPGTRIIRPTRRKAK
jgi:hypothetical protein